MGLVQQEWVSQSRGKMPLPRFYWQPWAAPVGGFRGSGVPPRFSLNRAWKALPRVAAL